MSAFLDSLRIIVLRTGLAAYLGAWFFVSIALAVSFVVALFTYVWLEKRVTRTVHRMLGAGGDRPSVPRSTSPRRHPRPAPRGAGPSDQTSGPSSLGAPRQAIGGKRHAPGS